MNKDRIENGIKEIEQIAKNIGLDFIPVIFETVTRDIMLEACSYGLPVRARHWSYGKSYDHQKIFGEMGYSKVYEVVFNNDPSYAFLLDTNPDIINLMVIAHVFGHSHFFKNNIMFKNSDRNMVHRAAERAARVDDYIMQYGVDKVEHIMDIAFALDNHIDWNKGLFRKRYPQKSTVNENIVRGEFDDLLGGGDNRSIKKKVINDNFPPKPERDLLWFLSNYAQLEDWERDILTIVREESYYFYPIVTTKVINEGFACVLKDTLIYTGGGIITMSNLIKNNNDIVFDGKINQKVVHSGVFKDRDIFKVYTKRGLELGGANNHRVLDVNDNWKQLDELHVGDKIKISGGQNLWSNEYKYVSFKNNKSKPLSQLCKENNISYNTYVRYFNNTHKTTLKNISIINNIKEKVENEHSLGYASPMGSRKNIIELDNKTIDENFGSFLGYLIGDGHVTQKARNVGLTSGDKEQIDDFNNIVHKLFNLTARVKFDNTSKNGRWRSLVYSVDLIELLMKKFGFKSGFSARVKEIPQAILQSPKSVISSFLRAYFDCDGCASETCGVILSTSSDKLAEQVQVILLNYGILSNRKKAKDGCWQLRIHGSSAVTFSKEIGFGLARKQAKLKKYIDSHKFFKREVWEDEIIDIKYIGKEDVYDITVENTHKYVAAGFINHNSFCHAEVMNIYDGMSEEEFIEFCKCHSGVINPGSQFSINPYYIGFKIFSDIRKKWDQLFNSGESEINGIQKVLKVAAEEDDASFLRNYLTVELAEDMGLFNYGYKHKRPVDIKEHDLSEKYGVIELKDRDLQAIIENIIRPTINYGAPLIEISDASSDTLSLSHIDNFGPLDEKYTEKTMSFIYELWGGPVELKTNRGGLLVRYYYDESGFDIL